MNEEQDLESALDELAKVVQTETVTEILLSLRAEMSYFQDPKMLQGYNRADRN